MPTPRIWTLEVSQTSDGLAVQPTATIALAAGDSLAWDFAFDVPAGTSPAILPVAGGAPDARSPLGPFTAVTHRSRRVEASGFDGVPREVRYRAALLAAGEDQVVVQSDEATLSFLVAPEAAPAPQEVVVSIELGDPAASPPGPPALRVAPLSLTIPAGAPVVWTFAIPVDLFGALTWYPEVLFLTDGPLGPFEAITALVDLPPDPAGRAQPQSIKVVGSGLRRTAGGEPIRGRFSYRCRIRSADGVLAVSSDDPGIDNEGEVMTPPP